MSAVFVFNLLYSVFLEIRDETYFFKYSQRIKLKQSFMLDTNYTGSYGIFELAVDFWLLLNGAKLTTDLIIFSKIFIFFMLLNLLWFSPLFYFLLFSFSFFKNIYLLAKAKLSSIRVEILPPLIQCTSLGQIFRFYFFLPKTWGFIALYYLIALKKKKISREAIDLLIFPLVFGKPFWFFKGLIRWTFVFARIISNPIWLRKDKLIWPQVFYELFEVEALNEVKQISFSLSIFTLNRKIIFDKEIKLNFPASSEFLDYVARHGLHGGNAFSKPQLFWSFGKPHQMFCQKNNPSHGYIGTTSGFIYSKNRAHETFVLNKDASWQRWFYSAVSMSNVDQKYTCFQKFFNLNKIHDEEDFLYQVLRLNLHFQLKESNEFIWQEKSRLQSILLKKNLTLSQIYTQNYHIGPNLSQAYITKITNDLNNLDNSSIKLNNLLFELENLNNLEFRKSFYYASWKIADFERAHYITYINGIKADFISIKNDNDVWLPH